MIETSAAGEDGSASPGLKIGSLTSVGREMRSYISNLRSPEEYFERYFAGKFIQIHSNSCKALRFFLLHASLSVRWILNPSGTWRFLLGMDLQKR